MVCVLRATPKHLPLKYKCPIKISKPNSAHLTYSFCKGPQKFLNLFFYLNFQTEAQRRCTIHYSMLMCIASQNFQCPVKLQKQGRKVTHRVWSDGADVKSGSPPSSILSDRSLNAITFASFSQC